MKKKYEECEEGSYKVIRIERKDKVNKVVKKKGKVKQKNLKKKIK